MSGMFPLGPGPLVSVLMPSRGRPVECASAIESLLGQAKDQSQVEVLIRQDDDDISDFVYPYGRHVRHKRGPRYSGYASLHMYYNELAAIAGGDWLLLFNDDAMMATPDWDQIIRNLGTYNRPMGIVPHYCLLVLNQIGDPASYSFVALRRRAYEVLGCVSPYLHVDYWLFTLFNCLDATINCPISVIHQKLDDRTADEGRTAAGDRWREMKTVEAMYTRLDQAGKLLHAIRRHVAEAAWQNEPDRPGWWWYREHGQPEKPMLVVDGHAQVKIHDNAMTNPVEGGGWWVIGPMPGSDVHSATFCLSSLRGEWSPIR